MGIIEVNMNQKTKLLVAITFLVIVFCLTSLADKNPDSKMVYIEGGTFRMGNIFSDGDPDEYPVHDVALKTYCMGKTEVTVGEFKKFVKATAYVTTAEAGGGEEMLDGAEIAHDTGKCWRKVNFKQNDSHPVVNVSWFDAIAYCNWRSVIEGLEPCYSREGDIIRCNFEADGYRLPTEAEYEYAARCRGREYKYSWGNGEPFINDVKAANIYDESSLNRWGKEFMGSGWKGYGDKYVYTSPVATFCPNEHGLYDMSGNVYEWCWDWYDETYYEISPMENPRGPERGEVRSFRDVGYDCQPEEARSANRSKGRPNDCFQNVGFRLVRSAR